MNIRSKFLKNACFGTSSATRSYRCLVADAVARFGLALLLLAGTMPSRATPVVNNNDGYFLDQYPDNQGIFSASGVHIGPPGTVSLISPNVSGNYRTMEIVPSSFDQWGQLTVAGSYGALADLQAEVRSQDGATILIAKQSVNVPIDLSGINPVTWPGIRVQVYFNKSGGVPPTLDSLEVTWHAVSRVLLDKQGPAQVQAGGSVVYNVRYSVSYVGAKGLVVWDPLPSYPAGTLSYAPQKSPTPYAGQDDSPLFVSATKGGVYTASATVVNGVTVPANSVYWSLGDVAEGVTDLLTFTVRTRLGTLDGTTIANQANGKGANTSPAQSQQVVTAIRSVPGPRVDNSAKLCAIAGKKQAIAGTINNFEISVGNGGTETMYKTVLYDDLTGLLPVITDRGTPGVPADDVFNISMGGVYVPNFDPDGPGGQAPFPAIVWNIGTLSAPGGFTASFSVELRNNPPQNQYFHNACVISDQSSPVCDQVAVQIGLDETPSVGFLKIASDDPVPYGNTLAFELRIINQSAGKLNDVVCVDKVQANMTFHGAWFNDPNVFLSGGRIFYSTSTLFPDPNNGPPVDYTQAPADLDVTGNNYWERYDLNPPADPGSVTWVAYFVPQLDSSCLPNLGTPALPPSTPISIVQAMYDVVVFSPADQCPDTQLYNRGLLSVYEKTDLNGVRSPISGGLKLTADRNVLAVGRKRSLGADASFTPLLPNVVTLPGSATYNLVVGNGRSANPTPPANLEAVIQLGQISVNGVLEYPSVQSISPAGTYDALQGRITVQMGPMIQDGGSTIQVQLGLPAGMQDGDEIVVGATVTGQDRCETGTVTTTARARVLSSPKLQVFKQPSVDLITSGAEYDYRLDYVNLGTAPSTGTYVVDRIPAGTVFIKAYGNPNITRVMFSADDNLPPQAVTPLIQINATTINNHFSPGTFHDNGTPGDPTDDYWTSPSGEATHWVAFEVDDPSLSPPLLATSRPGTVGFRVRNDTDPGPGVTGSPDGTRLPNTAAIFSDELLQAIGNQVITTVKDQPSIVLQKSGPSVVEAGLAFDWVVTYYDNSLTPANTVTITDTLPPGITFLTATHSWNAAALANSAPTDNNGQTVPTSVVHNLDGSTTLTFSIAGPSGYRGPGISLNALEGGTLTIHVQSDATIPCGSTRINTACGTASSGGEVVTSCASHQVNILCPDLELLKFVSPASVLAGGNLNYQLILNNRGALAARDVALTDTLPPGVSYVPGSLAVVTPGYTLAPPAISGQTLTWNTANGNALTKTALSPGVVPAASGNIIIQFKVQVDAGVPGCTVLNNVAQVSTPSVEAGFYPNVASASATVPPPELVVAKSGPDIARPGNRVSWNITWADQSAQAASGVYLVDTLPDKVTFVSVVVPSGVTPYYHGPAGAEPAFDPNNPLAPANGWTAAPGASVRYVALLVGTLAGNAALSAQVSVDLIDPNGGSPILPAPGTCFNNTVIIRQAVPLCENTANNVASATVCTPALDLALTKTGSVEGAIPGIAPGQVISYTLAYENTGTVNAYGVRVTDPLPAQLVPDNPLDNFSVIALVDAVGNPVNPVDQAGNPILGAVPVTRQISGNTITWYLGSTNPGDPLYYQKVGLPPGAKGSFQLRVAVAESVPDRTQVCNGASVAADVGTETVLGNNTSQSCVTVRRADVAVRKHGVETGSGDPNFVEFGNQITYTVEYNNLGSITAHDVRISEIVPTGTSLVSVNPPPGAVVTYSPSQANATSFQVQFDSLPAPANSVGVPAIRDTTAPSFVSYSTDCSNSIVTVTFSEKMDSVSATTVANYQISGGGMVLSAGMSSDGKTVNLLTSPLGGTYVLTIINLTDAAGNPLPTTPISFACGPSDCCAGCSPTNSVSNKVVFLEGNGYYVNPLCHGTSNTVTQLLPLAPLDDGGATFPGKLNMFYLMIWDKATQNWNSYYYENDFTENNFGAGYSGWAVDAVPSAPADVSSLTLEPGEGFWIINLGDKATNTWSGCIPGCPLPCAPQIGVTNFVGPVGLSTNNSYSSLFSCPPPCGTAVTLFTGGGFAEYDYINGAWTPQAPVIPAGTAVFVTVLPGSNCPTASDGCLPVDTNNVYEATGIANPTGFLGWGVLFVDANVSDGAHIEYSIGRLVGGTPVYDLGPLYTAVSVGPNGLDISGIDPANTSLVFRAQLFPSPTSGLMPCLRGWQMTYNAAYWPSFTFTVVVDGRGADSCQPLPIHNVVSASTTTPETTLDNNDASYDMQTRLTDLGVHCSVDKAAILPTQTLTYTLDWSVAGPLGAPAAYLQVQLADDGNGVADVTLGTVTPGPGVTAYYNTASTLSPPAFDPSLPLTGGWTTSPSGANHIAFLLGNQPPNSSGFISYTATVKPGPSGRTLCQSVVGHTSRRDPICDNDSCSSCTVVGTFANVFVEKTGPGCVHPGDFATFKITYGNNANAPAANVVVVDTLPAGLTFSSAVPPATGAGPTWNNLGATPGTLAAGESGVITVVAQLDNNYALVGQTLMNVATISTTSSELNLADNRAEAPLDCITPDFVSLSGFVYRDLNNNGVREPGLGETGIPGVTVSLTGTDVLGGAVALTTSTDQNGQYSFTGLYPGNYTVTETQPATWASTADNIGTVTLGIVNLGPRGSNANPLDDVLGPITLNGGEDGVEYDFGEHRLVFACTTNKTVECGSAWTFDVPAATSACCGSNLTITVLSTATNSAAACSQVITRTWQATDCCGDNDTCSQTVTVADTTPPTFICATNKTVECGSVWNFDAPAALDACSGTNVAVTVLGTITNGTGPCSSVITRTWQAMDCSSNSSSCSQAVTVRDTTPPVLSACQPICTNSLPGTNGTIVRYSVTATDNCDGLLLTTGVPASGSFFPIGQTLVNCTAVDHCGNTNACQFTVSVQGPADGPTNQTVCEGLTATFCTTPSGAGPFAYLWFKDSVLIPGKTSSCLAIPNAGLTNAGLYCVAVLGPCVAVTNCATLKINVCRQLELTTFTQGFYGNSNGKFNGKTSIALVTSLLTPNLVVGKPGRSLSIASNSASLLQQRLPANGSPATLPNSGDQNLATATLPLASKDKFANVLLGQTITLSLNARLDSHLLSFTLAPTFCSQGVLPGPDGLRGTADDQLVAGDFLTFTIPNSVLSALASPGLGINNSTVTGLLELANRALAGQPTGGASLADVNAAVDAINRGFDSCRALIDCATHTPLSTGYSDGIKNAPFLAAPHNTSFGLREPDIRPGPINLRIHASNIDATKEPGEPDIAGNPGGKSLWWQWQAPTSCLVTIQTAGSSFDTLLGVYTGTSFSNLTCVASNDDANGETTSQVTFFAQAGTIYQIGVDGFDGASGTVVLTMLGDRSLLGPPVLLAEDQVQLRIDGDLGYTFTIEASDDLVNWTPIASLDNNNGTLQFADPAARSADRRYYRVLAEF